MTTHPLGVSRWVLTRRGEPLHLRTSGTGEPLVLFESGMGGSSLVWGAVVPAVAARATTVVYDRAGLGRSPATESPRDLEHLADDLEDVLTTLRSEGAGPLVLVGHSWGGPIIRTVAARRPDDIRALVLVDQTDELCEMHVDAVGGRRDRILAAVYPKLARLGVMRPVLRRQARSLPANLRDELVRTDGSAAASAALLRELSSFGADLRRLHDEPLPAPSCPVTVISGTKPGPGEKASGPAVAAAHRQRAESLEHGRWVEAAGSGHLVQLSEPQIVVDEILRFID